MDWTDDVRIRVRPGRSVDELVDRILDASDSVRATPAFLAAVAGEFALSFEQARLALDRVQGGRVRAAGDGARRPDDDKDPVAASAWRRVTGARPATRNHDGSRWPALTEALAADSIADLRARLTSPAFAAAASADDRRAATVWTDAVATGAAPAEPIDAAAIERLVALAVATVELPDGLGVRDGVLRLTAALTAHAGADARERRGDEPIAAGTDRKSVV